MQSKVKPRLVYDGICNLCIGAVRFLNAIDPKRSLEYSPYQSLPQEISEKFMLNPSDLQGRMHIIQLDGSVVKGAAALAETCRLLSPLAAICRLLDTPLAGRLYDFIAARRYHLFGCRGSCRVPAAADSTSAENDA